MYSRNGALLLPQINIESGSSTLSSAIQYVLVFYQDNMLPHVAKICKDIVAAHNVPLFEWSAFISPDLSPTLHS